MGSSSITSMISVDELTKTTDSDEEDTLRTWSTSISVQLELMKQYKDTQLCSL